MLLKAEVNKIISGPHKVRKQAYKTVAVDASGQPGVSGYRSVENGVYVADVFVTVDLAAIARELGHKAMKNKSKQSRFLGGSVTVEAANIQHDEGSK